MSSASRRSASSRLGRAGTPLGLMAQHHATGPIPLAAAHTASGLHLLPGVIARARTPSPRATWTPWPRRPNSWRRPGRRWRLRSATPTPAEQSQGGRPAGGAGGGDADSWERAAGAGEADGRRPRRGRR
ncbi:DUF6245 family protein [Streptomyces sp. NPDC001833]|uniref:DUF6245 family protein n=1 Tax=Streptomyces sp. NPDC001833 TaxID=3154658 RepID=UPI0033200599